MVDYNTLSLYPKFNIMFTEPDIFDDLDTEIQFDEINDIDMWKEQQVFLDNGE